MTNEKSISGNWIGHLEIRLMNRYLISMKKYNLFRT